MEAFISDGRFVSALTAVAFIASFAFLNRARGSKLYELTSSTVVGRLVSMGLMAALCATIAYPDSIQMLVILVFTWGSLMLWCSPAWDAYWSAEIGHDPNHSRLWGLGAMTLRMTLAMPVVIGDSLIAGHPERCVYALGCLLMGLPYYIAGFFTKTVPILVAEMCVGGLLGFILFFTIS